MSLVDLLRSARSTPASVLHEFKLYFDPARSQIHAFVEGQPDKPFYSHFISTRIPAGTRLYLYDCRGKKTVLESMDRLKKDYPQARTLLFFVDKDIDDLVGPQLGADCLFCTEVYSIENYFLESEAIGRWLEENWRLRDVRFDFAPVLAEFERELQRFCRCMLPIMAWVVAHRLAGNKPVLTAVDIGKILQVDGDGKVVRRMNAGGRIAYLDRVAQVTTTRAVLLEVKKCIGRLRQIDALSWVRGKFSAWFFCAFVKRVEDSIRVLATEAGGTATCRIQTHENNFIECMVPKIREPAPLSIFLNGWLGQF